MSKMNMNPAESTKTIANMSKAAFRRFSLIGSYHERVGWLNGASDGMLLSAASLVLLLFHDFRKQFQ
ncbi:MAG: hypothetical protein RTU09_05305 [Candidatus Thorarchaeota archaeon]